MKRFPNKKQKVVDHDNLTVCYFGTYRSEYSRNRIMIEGLRKNDVKVIECHENLWIGINDRVAAVEKGIFNLKLWKRMGTTYFRLIRKFFNLQDFDVLVVGYPGQLDVVFAKILSVLKRKPLVWDIFMSTYLVSMERALNKKNAFSVKLLKFLEYIAIRLPNKLINDTSQYIDWFNKTYKIPKNKFCLVPTGADNDVFFTKNFIEYKPKDNFTVLYYGTYIPNHGIPYIIEAVKLLKDSPSIKFEFIGDGPELQYSKEKIQEYGLSNIQLLSWMDQQELKNHIIKADVILGAFGKTPQSLMTVQNKIYEGLAMGKLVITGQSEAIESTFENFSELIFCNRDDPLDLSNTIKQIKEDPQKINQISKKGYLFFKKNYSIIENGEKFKKILTSCV